MMLELMLYLLTMKKIEVIKKEVEFIHVDEVFSLLDKGVGNIYVGIEEPEGRFIATQDTSTTFPRCDWRICIDRNGQLYSKETCLKDSIKFEIARNSDLFLFDSLVEAVQWVTAED